jgi:hypothetical protein
MCAENVSDAEVKQSIELSFILILQTTPTGAIEKTALGQSLYHTLVE